MLNKMYSIIKPLLFKLPAETAHDLTLKLLKLAPSFLLKPKIKSNPKEVLGLTFPNQVGLAAGLDKNGDYIDALAKLGFGFIEIGTITPKAQDGNPKPRLFRLVEDKAIINRMGFNNKGVDYLVKQVQATRYKGILGINIGKNLATQVANAVDDYLYCFNKVYQCASYITVNVSSPNTPGLRELQHGDLLKELFTKLKIQQNILSDKHKRYVPMLAKLAPDLSCESLKQTADLLTQIGIDGFVFSNTTNERPKLQNKELASEKGGLSGKPLIAQSTSLLKVLAQQTELPIIGVGGISSSNDAKQKLANGASLIQLYSGLIFQGPKLITDCLKI